MSLKDGNVENGTLRVTIADDDTNLATINTNTGLKGYVKNSAGSDTLNASTATNKQNVVVSGVDNVSSTEKLNPLQVSNAGSLSTNLKVGDETLSLKDGNVENGTLRVTIADDDTNLLTLVNCINNTHMKTEATLQNGNNDVGNVTKKMSQKGPKFSLNAYVKDSDSGKEDRFIIDVTKYKSVTVSLSNLTSSSNEKIQLYMSHLKNDNQNHRFYVNTFPDIKGQNNSTSLTVDNPSNFLFIVNAHNSAISNIEHLVTGESYIQNHTYITSDVVDNDTVWT